jgi:HSP20 family protein
MPFFSRYHTPTSSDVFRLLDELNKFPSPTTDPSQDSNIRIRAFTPNFDIHETDSAFVLEGELPGLEDKSGVDIEFTDDNTLLVRGKIEKSIQRTSPNTQPEAANGSTPTAKGKPTDTQAAQRAHGSQKTVGNPIESCRYWASERTVGEFQRSFSFPGAVDIEAVKASLEHGLLKIVVPKKEAIKGRKIEIA